MCDTSKSDNTASELNVFITYEDIATKLLADRLLLTALELHTELVESGKELRLLKDFFSNPGHFEAHTDTNENSTLLTRSSSQATLDSLDFTRYSEDGEQTTDERVAVLEFQLRKAKETINALRNNLTVATESENSTPNKISDRQLSTDNIKPHEQRALNFLINEYLLLYGYKLTSITFADENENQDFEDWDDVGLNIAKPVELLTLYREGLKQIGHDLKTVDSQTDSLLQYGNLEKQIDRLNLELQENNSKLRSLESEIILFQNENTDLKRQNQILSCNQKSVMASDNVSDLVENTCDSSKNSTIGSISPEHFEIIDQRNLVSGNDDSIIALDDNISSTSLNEADWSDVRVKTSNFLERTCIQESSFLAFINLFEDNKIKSLKHTYKLELFKLCNVSYSLKEENDILADILNNGISNEKLVCILSESLLRIIPNIILNKREEVVPLLISTVLLNKDCKTRDKLLQQLFNLKKKPIDSERVAILTGIIGIAKYSKKCLVENEILPQCWEQLGHKYLERRLLVVESCIALIPYVSESIRNSLILSMLQQILEDREEIVRNSAVKGVALVISLCDDINKYIQCEELSLRILQDSSPIVVNSSIQILFPILAKWALEIGTIGTSLVKNLLYKLHDYLKTTKSEPASKIQLYPELALTVINVIDNLLPFILIYVANKKEITARIEKDMTIDLRTDLLNRCTYLTNPSSFCTREINVEMVLYEFDKLMIENSKISWFEMEWFLDNIIPELLDSLNLTKELPHDSLTDAFVNLFSHMCMVFGKHFTLYKIRPIFHSYFFNLEQILSNCNQSDINFNIIPVYLVSILSYCEDSEEIAEIFKRFLFILPTCEIKLNSLQVTVKGLCLHGYLEVVVSSLWEGVMHQKAAIREASAVLLSCIVKMCNETVLLTKVAPAIETLAKDKDMLVRTASIPALGSLITDCTYNEIHEKVYIQLEIFLTDSSTLENHLLLKQLIITVGNIAMSCKQSFTLEVLFPKLIRLTNYTYQMTNYIRKVDTAAALIKTFAKLLYCSMVDSHTAIYLLLPALRCLEAIARENPSFITHHNNILSMIRSVENKFHVTSSNSGEKSSIINSQSVEEVRQKVTKIFIPPIINKSTTLPHLQSIFKKK